jgi:hypothetical protein
VGREDRAVIDRLNELADEETSSMNKESLGDATEGDRERLRRLEVTLDQGWDLLHQCGARRSAGLDPEEASVRHEGTVEGYLG